MLDVNHTIKTLIEGKAGRGPSKNRPPNSPFGAFLSDGTPYLSPSQVATIHMCPARWKMGYIDRLPRRPGFASMMGTTAHAFMEVLAKPLHSGLLTDDEQVYQAVLPEARAIWTDRQLAPFLTAEGWTPEEAANGIARSVATASQQLRSWKGPLVLEQDNVVRTHVNGMPIGLRYVPDADHRGGRRVIDYKFPQKRQSKPKLEHVLAVLQYAWGHAQQGIPVSSIEILYTPIGASSSFNSVIHVTPARLAKAKEHFDRAANIVLAGNLHGTPTAAGHLCSPKWCDFYQQCGDAPTAYGIEVEV
jgi:hypothetical protein